MAFAADAALAPPQRLTLPPAEHLVRRPLSPAERTGAREPLVRALVAAVAVLSDVDDVVHRFRAGDGGAGVRAVRNEREEEGGEGDKEDEGG